MKRAVVKPVHKKECTEDPSNYRPLSILPAASKVFERAATDQIVKYLEENKLLNITQHAYRKWHSTQTCLNEIVNYIYTEMDKGNFIGLASLDLSKAFDSVNHSHLLKKLKMLGLGRNSLEWCSSYLTERKQKTKFKKYTSTWETVTSGVPQGSIFGPILFICYTNDMYEIFQDCKIVSYSDDSQILVSAKSEKQVKTKLEEVTKLAQKWYTENSLLNNAGKTEVMLISTHRRKEAIKIDVTEEGNKKQLEMQRSVKILGVYLDEEMKWTRNVNEINKKARNATRNLQRVNHILPFKSKLILYNSLVASHFNYCDTIWGGCNQINKNKLQRTQNLAIKSILGMKKDAPSETALKQAHMLNLQDKREIHEAVFTQKALTGRQPTAIISEYQQYRSLKNNRSADRKILTIPKHKTENFKNSPIYRTIKTWNNMPQELKEAENTNFKARCQKYKHTGKH